MSRREMAVYMALCPVMAWGTLRHGDVDLFNAFLLFGLGALFSAIAAMLYVSRPEGPYEVNA